MADYLKIRLNHSAAQWVDIEVKRNNDKQDWRLHAVREINGFERITVGELINLVKAQASQYLEEAKALRSLEQQVQIKALAIACQQTSESLKSYRNYETTLNAWA